MGIALLTLTLAGVAHAGPSVEVWTRAPGNHSAVKNMKKADRRWVNLQSHPAITERVLKDPQYDAERTYRGVPLKDLVGTPPPGNDLALLHFKNGALIPVSTNPDVLGRIDALVAVAWKPRGGAWQTTFPEMHREPGAVDPRPLKFEGNKLVVPTQYHPYLADSADDGFSPWRWVDSLTGVEFVSGNAYFGQFVPKTGDDNVKRGLKAFLQHCQYCHSAHDVGARYGGDFLRPFPLHTLKKPEDLYDHVTINKMDAMNRGLMMPVQKNIDPEDIAAILKWVEALSKQRNTQAYPDAKKATPSK